MLRQARDQAIRQADIGFGNVGDVFGFTFTLHLFHGNRIIVLLASAAIVRSFIGGCRISRIDKAFFNNQIAAVIDIEENAATRFIIIAIGRLLHCFDQRRNFIITVVSLSSLVFIHGMIVVDERIGFCLQCINFGFLFVAEFGYASLAVLIIETFLALNSLRWFYPSPALRTKFLCFAFKFF